MTTLRIADDGSPWLVARLWDSVDDPEPASTLRSFARSSLGLLLTYAREQNWRVFRDKIYNEHHTVFSPRQLILQRELERARRRPADPITGASNFFSPQSVHRLRGYQPIGDGCYRRAILGVPT